ncbi:MAG: ATP-dependent Clp protease ATP-binding subunit ClpC, partial [Oscillospiraceae bacterium]|nr:ATP-dependent Clp protease ATP-binding subunit ClpC [Oscillospiraceae bacterium]
MGMEERFTESAQRVMELAQSAAAELGHGYLGTEHMLVGLIREDGGAAARVLREHGLDESLILEMIEKHIGRGKRGDTPQGLTPRAKHVIELAVREANRLGHSAIGTEHLLMGILREYESVASRIIVATGVDVNKMYSDLVGAVSGDPEAVRQPVSAGAGQKGETKTLDQFSRDLNQAAIQGKLDSVIGREEEIQRVIQ